MTPSNWDDWICSYNSTYRLVSVGSQSPVTCCHVSSPSSIRALALVQRRVREQHDQDVVVQLRAERSLGCVTSGVRDRVCRVFCLCEQLVPRVESTHVRPELDRPVAERVSVAVVVVMIADHLYVEPFAPCTTRGGPATPMFRWCQ